MHPALKISYFVNVLWRLENIIAYEFRSPKQKWQKMIVIQSPNPMAPSWFEVILKLHFPHEVNILVVDLPHHLFEFRLIVISKFQQTPAEKHEGKFVPRSVVNPCVVSERLYDIAIQLISGSGNRTGNKFFQELFGVLFCLF